MTTNLEAAKKITGRLKLTNPKAAYVSSDSSYGAVLKVTYDVKNASNVTVNVLGPASDKHSKLYKDQDGSEMLVNCTWPFPLKPGESSTCTMYRLITRGEKVAGITFGDAPQFFPSYQVGGERTRILLDAEAVGLVPLFERKK